MRCNVQRRVNARRDGLDLSSKILFNLETEKNQLKNKKATVSCQFQTPYLVQSISVIVRNHGNGNTKVSITTGTTNTVQVSLCTLGKVKVDDDVNGLNVDTTSEQVTANKATTIALKMKE